VLDRVCRAPCGDSRHASHRWPRRSMTGSAGGCWTLPLAVGCHHVGFMSASMLICRTRYSRTQLKSLVGRKEQFTEQQFTEPNPTYSQRSPASLESTQEAKTKWFRRQQFGPFIRSVARPDHDGPAWSNTRGGARRDAPLASTGTGLARTRRSRPTPGHHPVRAGPNSAPGTLRPCKRPC
jgi:hypothetical protein